MAAGAFTLTTARLADLPNQPGAVTKNMCYHYISNGTFAVSAPSVASFQQTLPLLTAKASIVLPAVPGAVGLALYHAYLVYDATGNFHLASNPVSLLTVQ